MDFVFDRSPEGRVVKCLTVVDDATHDAAAVVARRATGGLMVTRILEGLGASLDLPQVIRADNA